MTLIINGRSDAGLLVPTADSALNQTIVDVIGTKLDTIAGDSLYALATLAASQVASSSSCYPLLAAGATVISANADYTWGAYATVIPASTIAVAYRLTDIAVESCNRDAQFVLELSQGDGDTVISRTRFTVSGGYYGNVARPVSSGLLPADTRVRARVASSNGAAQIATLTISVSYWPF